MNKYLPIAAFALLSACGGGTGIVPAAISPPPGPAAPAPAPGSSGGGTTGGAPSGGSGGGAPSAPSTVDDLTFSSQLNNVRLTNGAGNVAFDARLAAAAQGHADDMLAQNYFSHTGLNGSSPGDRITAEGYQWRTYGENIAQGQRSEEEVLDAWTNSPGHHANNINPNFEDYGLAKAGTGSDTRWVLLLAAEQ